jgi:hypothetical protein
MKSLITHLLFVFLASIAKDCFVGPGTLKPSVTVKCYGECLRVDAITKCGWYAADLSVAPFPDVWLYRGEAPIGDPATVFLQPVGRQVGPSAAPPDDEPDSQ